MKICAIIWLGWSNGGTEPALPIINDNLKNQSKKPTIIGFMVSEIRTSSRSPPFQKEPNNGRPRPIQPSRQI